MDRYSDDAWKVATSDGRQSIGIDLYPIFSGEWCRLGDSNT
ncbi:hypothetical protein [Alteraurantiacibacter aestuarii]|nr:hypothetical protein [Alteraurantiacibacter aestuarii]